MAAPQPPINLASSPPPGRLTKENWLSIPEYTNMQLMFPGRPQRFQLLQKKPSAKHRTQPSKPQPSPAAPDAAHSALSLPVSKKPSRSPVLTPDPMSHDIRVSADPFFQSDLVYSLTVSNCREFLARKAAALVLFYCPHDKGITDIKNHYSTSAASTKRENHAYAAVDCTTEPDLCTAFGITLTPFVAYYSRGIKIDSGLVESKEFVKDDLRFFMEQAPVYHDPKLKAYGRLLQARKTLRGIKSPGRRPPEMSVSPGKKSLETSQQTSRTPTKGRLTSKDVRSTREDVHSPVA